MHCFVSSRAPRRWALVSSAALACLLAGSGHAQTAETLNTRSLAATCAACHGTDGRAVSGSGGAAGMVPLAGLPATHIASQMRAFRDGQRPATVMHQISKGYTDAQIDRIAAYFAAQSAAQPK